MPTVTPKAPLRVPGGRAEAGRTNERTIRAAKTALGDIVPPGVFEIGIEQFTNVPSIHLPHLDSRSPVHGHLSEVLVLFVCVMMFQIGQDVTAELASHLHQEPVLAAAH